MPDKSRYYDPLRRRWVAASPEEKVRQWFIGVLSGQCLVPEHMMMSEVPMKYGEKQWRADIVVYSVTGKPLAITECKRPEVPVGDNAAEQALRYHAVQDVRYIFLTNGKSTYAFCRDGDAFTMMKELPTYSQMNSQCPL